MTRDLDLLVGVDCQLTLYLVRRHFGFTFKIPVGTWIVRGSDSDTIHRVRQCALAWALEGVPSWSMDQVFAYHGLEFIHVPLVSSPIADQP